MDRKKNSDNLKRTFQREPEPISGIRLSATADGDQNTNQVIKKMVQENKFKHEQSSRRFCNISRRGGKK